MSDDTQNFQEQQSQHQNDDGTGDAAALGGGKAGTDVVACHVAGGCGDAQQEDHLTERNYQNRTIGLMENGSWAPLAAKVMAKMLEGSKNLTFTDTTVKIMSALSDESRAQIEAMAEELCK